jgi:hypothetical protein
MLSPMGTRALLIGLAFGALSTPAAGRAFSCARWARCGSNSTRA